MRRRATVLASAAAVLLTACGPSDRSRSRDRYPDVAEVDSVAPISTRPEFEVPPSWVLVRNPIMHFRQPPGFTFGLNAARVDSCDSETPRADVPVVDRGFLEIWPLTLAMRRGDLNEIARTNGFTLDSAEIAAHEGDSTTVRRGEGWLLLSGRSPTASITFASVRAPGGCYLILAARGMEIDPDTLGLVLTTLRFGPAPIDPPASQ